MARLFCEFLVQEKSVERIRTRQSYPGRVEFSELKPKVRGRDATKRFSIRKWPEMFSVKRGSVHALSNTWFHLSSRRSRRYELMGWISRREKRAIVVFVTFLYEFYYRSTHIIYKKKSPVTCAFDGAWPVPLTRRVRSVWTWAQPKYSTVNRSICPEAGETIK